MIEQILFLLSFTIILQARTITTETFRECSEDKFLSQNGFCCLLCVKGSYLYKPCRINGELPLCVPCWHGETYMDKRTNLTKCHPCRKCDPETEVEKTPCYLDQNKECDCREGFQKVDAHSVCVHLDGPENLPTYNDDEKPWKIYLPITYSLVGALIFIILALYVSRIKKKNQILSQAVSNLLSRNMKKSRGVPQESHSSRLEAPDMSQVLPSTTMPFLSHTTEEEQKITIPLPTLG